MKTTNVNNGKEVNNAVNNNVSTNVEAKKFIASIYQLSKSDQPTFNLTLNGTIKDTNNLDSIADLFSKRLFKVYQAQNNIKENANKSRFFKLSKGAKLFFYFAINSRSLIHTELNESLKIRLSDVQTTEQLNIILSECFNVFNDLDNIEL